MPKYLLRDGTTFEVISIKEAEKQIEANGGEDKLSPLDKFTDWIYYLWNKNLRPR